MALTVQLRTATTIPVEVDAIHLASVRGENADSVARQRVFHGNETVELGELFTVSGTAVDDNEIVWQGDLHHVKRIGQSHSNGHVRIEGNAGMHTGERMSGGTLTVNGHVSDWLGAEMSGGRIIVHGNAGHLVGAAYRGAVKGMTGGEILIHGNAGDEIGQRMRRGLIAVGGDAGDFAGASMIAGSIFVFGDSGQRYGLGMKRGTIVLMNHSKEDSKTILPTFLAASSFVPPFLGLYLQYLRQHKFPIDSIDRSAPNHQHLFDRYLGDFLEYGKGEILTRC